MTFVNSDDLWELLYKGEIIDTFLDEADARGQMLLMIEEDKGYKEEDFVIGKVEWDWPDDRSTEK